MDGIINLLKPPGMTSADVVAYLRKILKQKKIGHTGTLDPGVTGVLPICIGKATRLAEYLTAQGKYYRAEITFGVTTNTQDAFGQVLQNINPSISKQDVLDILPDFLGTISQIPPMFSAVRKAGKHLYEYARQGIEVERALRQVNISKLTLEYWQKGEYPKAILDIECSKGTYVRTLCHDIGEALGCGAHMSYLLRLRSGPFRIEDSWTLEEIETAVSGNDFSFLLPLNTGLDLRMIKLSYSRGNAFRNGLPTRIEQGLGFEIEEKAKFQVLAEDDLIGIGEWRNGQLYPYKVFR